MNEADTRANLIDPQLKEAGWGVVAGSRVRREYKISAGEIKAGGMRKGKLSADYVLIHKSRILAAIEAKSDETEVGEGVGQAKNYAEKLKAPMAFAANGKEIYQICRTTGKEGLCDAFPSPDTLWQQFHGKKQNPKQKQWQDQFDAIPLQRNIGKESRYYQELAIQNVMDAIAAGKSRILLTLATGTGKTFIAAQIAWKLFKSRWTKNGQSGQPRILFLTDRNFLAGQAYLAFSMFPPDALQRVTPDAIRQRGSVPKNAGIFFTIFQTFMSGEKPYFGDYEPDFFDFIVIDECHRGGANNESKWRGILEYFASAVQLGLTATPKRKDNANTYKYFGNPIYSYSLKEGIQDGYLTPFRVKRIQTSLDQYTYEDDDTVLQGEVDENHTYTENEFNTKIQIESRERIRTRLMLANINRDEKTIVFCHTQEHAALIRDLTNQEAQKKSTDYCVRVTSADGTIGDNHLRSFQDNEKIIPTIVTTSRKLSTGVDARNIRNIVLMRPINDMIEFKQIIGRGTRLFEGKDYFTIIDFVGASHKFHDENWDGKTQHEEDIEYNAASEEVKKSRKSPSENKKPTQPQSEKIKIKLADGKEQEVVIRSSEELMIDGKLIKKEDYRKSLLKQLQLPDTFKTHQELQSLWANPTERVELLKRLEDKGFDRSNLEGLQKIFQAENSDLLDVLEYILYASPPVSRTERVRAAKDNIYAPLEREQRKFVDFVLTNYVRDGVDELDDSKLSKVLELKYSSLSSAKEKLGNVETIRKTFIAFQKHLYLQDSA